MDTYENSKKFDEAVKCLGIFQAILNLPYQIKSKVQEVRIRVDKPLMLTLPNDNLFVDENGKGCSVASTNSLIANKENMDEMFRNLCNYSVHSHQREIKNGFITIKGGHRAGICGTAVTDNNEITNLRDISSINLRIAREIKGVSKDLVNFLLADEYINGMLVFGSPGCGKTTVLRDLARLLADGSSNNKFYRVCIVDERGELAATFEGVPQNDLGISCDILDGYPKSEGITQSIRSLSPDFIICDEIGSLEDVKALENSINAGVTIIASVHAKDIQELISRPLIKKLILDGAFKKAVALKNRNHPGEINNTYVDLKKYVDDSEK